jgi:uncharacterized delta-60 repeat protein
VDFCLVRYQSNGSLDPTFGTAGTVVTDFSNGSDIAVGALVQPDGRIVVGGFTDELVSAFARYLPNGAPDPSFGVNGKATFDVPATREIIRDIALQADGKIVAVGNADLDFLALRLNGNGSVDPTFGGNGFVVTNIGIADEAKAVDIQPDGRIIVAGRTDQAPTRFGVVRYTVQGALDITFGGDGIATVEFGQGDVAFALTLQPDGKIVVAGSTVTEGASKSAVARLNTDGALDPTFSGDGKAITDAVPGNEQVQKVEIDSGGRIVAAIGTPEQQNSFTVSRYNANGSSDTSFGNGGIVNTDISGGAFTRAAVLYGDKLVVAGEGQNVLGIRLARYNLLSTPSASSDFDGDGLGDATVFRPSQGTWFTVNSIDGTVSINQFGLNGDLPVDGDFDGDGLSDLAVFRPSDGGWFIRRSSNPTNFISVSFGQNGDRPVASDYDKDGKTDIAVWRPSNGTYFILRSSDTQSSFFAFPFGKAGDIPLSSAAQ